MANQATIPTASGAVTVLHNQAVKPPELSDAQKEAIDKAMRALSTKLEGVVDDEVNTLIVNIEAHKKEAAIGPFRIMRWAMEHIDAEKLKLFPTPGTDYTTSGVPDKYDEVYFRDGKKRFRKTSFYLQFFLKSFPEGKRIASELNHVAVAKDDKANHASLPDNIRSMNPVDLENYREDLVSRQNSGVKAIRDAFALMKQMEAVAALPKVGVDLLYDKDGDVRKTSKPIKVWNLDKPEDEWYLYSISGFMQFDPDKAAELKGDIDSLKLTAKREPGEDEPDPGTATAPVSINTNATFTARLNDVHEFIQNKLMGDPKRELQAMFLKEHVYGAGSDDLIETLDDIRSWASHILSIPAVAARLEAIAQRPAKDKVAVR